MKVFLEKQFLNRVWLFMFILSIIVIVLGTAYYATNNAEEDTAILVSVIAVVIAFPLAFALLKLKLETRIDEKGIFTYFSPFGFTKKFIPWDDVSKCYTRKYSPTEEFGGWGLRGLGRSWKAYNVTGNTGIEIETKEGNKYLIGTLKPKEAGETINYYFKK